MVLKQVQNIVMCKCPSCHKGKMFQTNGNPLLFKIPKMNVRCPKCDFKFEREIGFFYGAMYASYALTVAEMVACFIIFWVILKFPPLTIVAIVAGVAFLASTFNYRVGRSIWLYIFSKKGIRFS